MESNFKWTNQSAFNRVVEWLLRPGYKQCKKGYYCLYRHGKNRCAVGILIPKSDYDPTFDSDNMAVADVAERVPALSDVSLTLLQDLQYLHDDVLHVVSKKALKRIANKHGLKFRGKR